MKPLVRVTRITPLAGEGPPPTVLCTVDEDEEGEGEGDAKGKRDRKWDLEGDRCVLRVRPILRGGASRVLLAISEEGESLARAEVEVCLTGAASKLRASAPPSSAVSGKLYGPIRVEALDAEGHVVRACGASLWCGG